ncbi:MAG: amidohydrolase family protein [Acidobacteriota bacterium]
MNRFRFLIAILDARRFLVLGLGLGLCVVAASAGQAAAGMPNHPPGRADPPGTNLPATSTAGTLLFDDVTILDGTGRPPMPHAHLLVREGRIERLGRTAWKVSGQVRRIDGHGRYLIPGLIDVHVHVVGGFADEDEGDTGKQAGVRALHGYLYSGVTTIFDAGNDPDYIFGLRAAERAGALVAPHLLAAGGIVTVPGGHGGFTPSTLIETWPGARSVLDAEIALAPDMVKFTYDEHNWGTRPLIPLLPLDLMQHAIEYLNDHGLRTTVHTSNEIRAREAIFAGIDTLAHPVIQSPVSDGFVALMAAKQVPMASTLTIGEGYSRLVDHPEFLDAPLYAAVFEPGEIARLKGEVRDRYAARAWTTWMKVMTPVAQENLRRIDAAGGVIALGSDQSNGPASQRELELLVQGGIPPLSALKIATLNSAVFLGRARETGSIEEGKVADLVLLSANPLDDISHLQSIDMVVKAGRIIDRAALDLPVNR